MFTARALTWADASDAGNTRLIGPALGETWPRYFPCSTSAWATIRRSSSSPVSSPKRVALVSCSRLPGLVLLLGPCFLPAQSF